MIKKVVDFQENRRVYERNVPPSVFSRRLKKFSLLFSPLFFWRHSGFAEAKSHEDVLPVHKHTKQQMLHVYGTKSWQQKRSHQRPDMKLKKLIITTNRQRNISFHSIHFNRDVYICIDSIMFKNIFKIYINSVESNQEIGKWFDEAKSTWSDLMIWFSHYFFPLCIYVMLVIQNHIFDSGNLSWFSYVTLIRRFHCMFWSCR